ncbi:MAG TPA: STAS domain-containing protein [Acidimicrobiales bacterium]|jgi:anti-sigma B factor antagonist|nr:STAS domain-containing protein [Acidimicrobiales bacterium]
MEELGDGEAKGWVEVLEDEDGAIVELGGEIDVSNVDLAQKAIADLLESRPKRLIFDLSGITFMDSSGLGLLLLAQRETESVEIREASAIAERVIEATGLAEYLRLDRRDG